MFHEHLRTAMARIRERKGLSQTTAALRAGVANSTWSVWESGERAPKDGSIPQICRGLGCSRFELEMKVNQLHTDALTEQATRLRAAPPAHHATELIDKAEQLMKLDVHRLPDELHRAFASLRNFGVILSTQYQPLMDAIIELYLLVRTPDQGR